MMIGAYVGGALANKNMDIGKWDFNNYQTYIGIIGGAVAGLGTVSLIGAAMQNSLAIKIGAEIGSAFKATVDFAVVGGKFVMQGAGWITAAGGGAYMTYSAAKEILNGYRSGQRVNDPYQNGHGETIYTMDQFLIANKGLTRSEIINQRQDRSKTFLGSQPGGPNMRYVVNPHDGRVLDMRHMLVVGRQPVAVGNLLEMFQWSTRQASGMDPQDFYSNGVGYQFYMQYSGVRNLFSPSTFTDQMRSFFYSPRVIYNW